MREILPGLLWVSNAHDARDHSLLFKNEVLAVVDLAIDESPAMLPREIIYCRIPLQDSNANDPANLELAIGTTVSLLANNTKSVVCCSAGMSRSPTIATFAAAIVTDEDPTQMLAQSSPTMPHDVSPGFWNSCLVVYREMLEDRKSLN